MEFRLLRYFLAVAETANFSRAAETVHLTQPALSQAVRALEKDLGCTLFTRGHGVRLTPAGERLREHCLRILPMLQDVRDDLAELQGGLQGTIRPAVLESLLLYLLPPIISRFSSTFPQVKFTFSMQETRDIEHSVLSGDSHFGLVSRPPASRKLEALTLASFPHVLVAPAGTTGSTAQLLKKHALFLLGDWQVAALEENTDVLKKHPNLRILNPINHVAVVRQLVAQNLGLAILPSFVVNVELRVLQSFSDWRMSAILLRDPQRTRLAAAETFMEFLKEKNVGVQDVAAGSCRNSPG